MRNFIIIYNFSDEASNKNFEKEIKETWPEHKIEEYQEVEYFAFPARELPEIEDKLSTILHNFGIGTKDYVALYYTRPEQPDEINRVMVLGHDEYIETDIEKVPVKDHQETLAELLEFDFMKERFK